MIKKLLVVFAAAALISMACFTVLAIMGVPASWGPPGWGPNGPPWLNGGDWGNNRRYAGPDVTRDLPFSGDRLDISYPADITYTQGTETRFTVTGPQYILDQLRLEDGSVRWEGFGRRGRWGPRYRGGRLQINIVSPTLHEFYLSSAQQLRIHDFNQDRLLIQASGAVDVEGSGRARELEARISGAGDLKLDQLTVDDARVSISGAGDAHIDARRSSEVSLSGAGDVQVRCRPSSTSDHKTGFGDIGYGPDCSTLPPPAAPSAVPAAPAPPAQPAPPPVAPAPKSKV